MNVPELLRISGGYWHSCTIHAGVKLDVFSVLAGTPRTAQELAHHLQADTRSLEMLLNALTAMALLEKREEHFLTTTFSATHLNRDSPDYIGHIILHHHNLVEGWGKLDQAVQQGGPVRSRSTQDPDGSERENFLMGMFNLASMLAPHIAANVDLQGRRRLLDLGGGPGTYAIHFCKYNPDLSAVIYDLPTTRPFAEQTVQRSALGDRIVFHGRNILHDPIVAAFGVVWVSHLLHAHGPEACETIIAKAAAALHPGGLLLIQEFLLDDNRVAPLQPALFSLNMLIGTPSGQSYSQGEVAHMLAAAGMVDIRRLPIKLPNGAGIMAGVRPNGPG